MAAETTRNIIDPRYWFPGRVGRAKNGFRGFYERERRADKSATQKEEQFVTCQPLRSRVGLCIHSIIIATLQVALP